MSKMRGLLLILAAFCWIDFSSSVDLTGCRPNPPAVIDAFFNPKGSIYSPGYKEGVPYPNDLSCVYNIRAPYGYRIKLNFKFLDIDPFDLCMKDRLAIHEGDGPQHPIHGIFCGNQTPNALISGGNGLHIRFDSDFLTGKKGFQLEYEAGLGHALCPFGKAVCRNRNCYTIAEKCNGIDECGDGTDEENCGKQASAMECGRQVIKPKSSYLGQDRVIGGKEADYGSWPWQADCQLSYFHPNGHMCGGTLIAGQWVLLAAHCVQQNTQPGHWRIHLGNHNKFKNDSHEQVRHVERIIVYPGLTGQQFQGNFDMANDVCLMKLNAPVKFTDYVRPACLPSQGQEVPTGTKCMATGWGMTRGTGNNDVLKQVDLSVRNAKECENNMVAFNNRTMICVANDKGYQDVCHGDSGGPLTWKGPDSRWYVVGATSFGTATNYESGMCGLPVARTVYAKISDKVTWINKMISMYS